MDTGGRVTHGAVTEERTPTWRNSVGVPTSPATYKLWFFHIDITFNRTRPKPNKHYFFIDLPQIKHSGFIYLANISDNHYY